MRHHESVDAFQGADFAMERNQCNLSNRVVSDPEYMCYRGQSRADSSLKIDNDGCMSFGSAFDTCSQNRNERICAGDNYLKVASSSFNNLTDDWNRVLSDLRTGNESQLMRDLKEFFYDIYKELGLVPGISTPSDTVSTPSGRRSPSTDGTMPTDRRSPSTTDGITDGPSSNSDQPRSAQDYTKEHASEIEKAFHVKPGQDLNQAIQDHPGEMIVVDGGTYSGPFNLTADGTKLVGINGATIKGSSEAVDGRSYNAAVNLKGHDQDVVGFNIDGNDAHTVGIVSWEEGNGNNIIGNNIFNSRETAIADWSHAAGGSNIIGNKITDVGNPDTQLAHGIYYDAGDGTIANNTITHVKGGFGIQLWDGHDFSLSNITVNNNTVDGASKAGLVIGDDPDVGSATAHNITVENNLLKNNGTYGIEFYGRYDTGSIRLANNQVSGNGDDNVSYQ